MVCPTGTQGMAGKTISEKILSAKAGVDARAGDVVVCRVDCAMGTDGSAPMAIDYFEAMGGGPVRDAARMVFALDHYAPAPNRAMALLHQRLRRAIWDRTLGRGRRHRPSTDGGIGPRASGRTGGGGRQPHGDLRCAECF